MSETNAGTPEPLMGDAYWNLLERTARRVEAWPTWKRGVREANMSNKPNDTSAVELAREVIYAATHVAGRNFIDWHESAKTFAREVIAQAERIAELERQLSLR